MSGKFHHLCVANFKDRWRRYVGGRPIDKCRTAFLGVAAVGVGGVLGVVMMRVGSYQKIKSILPTKIIIEGSSHHANLKCRVSTRGQLLGTISHQSLVLASFECGVLLLLFWLGKNERMKIKIMINKTWSCASNTQVKKLNVLQNLVLVCEQRSNLSVPGLRRLEWLHADTHQRNSRKAMQFVESALPRGKPDPDQPPAVS